MITIAPESEPLLVNDILVRQNEEKRLDLLRAQRAYYRRAKRLQTVFLVCALALPWASSFWGPDDTQVRPMLALLSVFLLLVDIGLATRLQRDWIKTAARIQEQFDTEVLGLPWNQFVVGSKVDPESIRSVTRKPMTDQERTALLGWYEQCVGSVPLSVGRLVCQRTNITYDMRVRRGYAWGCLALAMLMFLGFLFHGIHAGLSLPDLILKVIVPFVPLAAFVLREHRKQADTVETLTTLKAEVEKLWAKALKEPASPELEQDARNLQDAIYRNRTSNPLVYDWVYWLSRKLNEDAAHHAAETLVAEAKRDAAMGGCERMKLHEHFKTFLKDHVNLNETRLSLLTASVDAVQSAVRQLDWGPKILGFEEQGSWAHGTIIKPQSGSSFDADLLVLVEPVPDWTPRDYVNKLATELNLMPAYKDKVRRFSHCATIEYAGERKIDIAPCLVDRQYPGTHEVCNRGSDEFERSEPLAYTDWVTGQNGIAGSNDLKKATRLLKYMRDIKGNFTCPSFLLTTLLGYRVHETDRNSAQFADLPTTLKTLVDRLDDWLQARPERPEVMNPVFYGDDQAVEWEQAKYVNFRDKVNLYRSWIDDAFDEVDKEESIGKWRRVFGEGFAESDSKRAAEKISESITTSVGTSLVTANHFTDLVAMVKALGLGAVPPRIHKLPHIERPKWRRASEQLTVRMNVELKTSEYGQFIRSTRSGEPLQAGYAVKFTAVSSNGAPFQTDAFDVRWRVTNTDRVAGAANQLRGGFYSSDEGATRIETLRYRGVHFVEAFVVRKRDQRLTGTSEPFYVVIE